MQKRVFIEGAAIQQKHQKPTGTGSKRKNSQKRRTYSLF